MKNIQGFKYRKTNIIRIPQHRAMDSASIFYLVIALVVKGVLIVVIKILRIYAGD